MNRPGVRTQNTVVNLVAQRGYDRVITLEKRCKQIKEMPTRQCFLDDCNVVLSKYNDTNYCALHQRGNIPVPKFL